MFNSVTLSQTLNSTVAKADQPDSAQPLVSVIIPCYNQAKLLSFAIESVLGQSYRNFEIIVVDDGSQDETEQVASQYSAVKYIRQSNRGVAMARNSGWRASAGQYLVFLDSDDRLLPDALLFGVRDLNRHPDAALTFGRCRVVFTGSAFKYEQPPQPTSDFYTALLRGCPIWHPGAMMCRRSVFQSGLEFDDFIPMSSDFYFYLRAARQFQIRFQNNLVSEYVHHEENASGNLHEAMSGTLRVMQLQLPYAAQCPEYKAAYNEGVLNAYRSVAHRLFNELLARPCSRTARTALLQTLYVLFRTPRAIPTVIAVLNERRKKLQIACDRKLLLQFFRLLRTR